MNDNIIQFPGAGGQEADDTGNDQVSPEGSGATGIPGLTADQEKAIQIVMEGMSFVVVGIKPTESGADFFTAIHGQRQDLANAGPHLDGVIQRAFERLGIS